MPQRRRKPTLVGYKQSLVSEITRAKPERSLVEKQSTGGRNNYGRKPLVTVEAGINNSIGELISDGIKMGSQPKLLPLNTSNRSCRILLLHYHDGKTMYSCSKGVEVGETLQSGHVS